MAVFHKWGTWVQVICNDLETLPEHRSRNWKCSRSIWVLWPWQALVRSQSNPEEDWWSLGPSFLGSSEPHNSCRRDMFHRFHLHPSRLCNIPCTLQGLRGHCQASLRPHQSCKLQIIELGLQNLGLGLCKTRIVKLGRETCDRTRCSWNSCLQARQGRSNRGTHPT